MAKPGTIVSQPLIHVQLEIFFQSRKEASIPFVDASTGAILNCNALGHQVLEVATFRESGGKRLSVDLTHFKDDLIRKFRKHWNSLRTPKQEEGLDFDISENKLHLQRLEEISQGTAGFLSRNVGALRWVTGLIVALMTAGLPTLDYPANFSSESSKIAHQNLYEESNLNGSLGIEKRPSRKVLVLLERLRRYLVF